MTTEIFTRTADSGASHHETAASAAARPVYDLTRAPLGSERGKAPQQDMETLVLRAAIREGITSSEGLAAFLPRIQQRFGALLGAIDADSPAAHAFGHRFDADYKTHVSPGNEHAVAMQDVQSIFINRSSDITAALPLLADAEFVAGIAARLGQPLPPLNTALSPAKLTEIRQALTADGNGGHDSPAHFKRNFLEHHKFHGALMEAFTAGSDVALRLEETMSAALPETEKTGAQAMLADWLVLRAERARNVMEATRPDGEMAQSAVKEWGEGRRHQQVPASATGAPRPSTVIEKAGTLYQQLLHDVASASVAEPSATAR